VANAGASRRVRNGWGNRDCIVRPHGRCQQKGVEREVPRLVLVITSPSVSISVDLHGAQHFRVGSMLQYSCVRFHLPRTGCASDPTRPLVGAVDAEHASFKKPWHRHGVGFTVPITSTASYTATPDLKYHVQRPRDVSSAAYSTAVPRPDASIQRFAGLSSYHWQELRRCPASKGFQRHPRRR
jgi:hypothetical protein